MIQPLLPPAKPRRFRYPGRQRVGDREALAGILFVLRTGIPRQELPTELGCGCGMTCWRRLQEWQAAGVWFALHQTLLARLDEAGKIDWDRASVDTSFARARGGVEVNEPTPTDRGRTGVKHHLLVDASGIPLAGEVTGVNKPDAFGTLPLVDSAGPLDPEGEHEGPGGRPGELYGDRAHDAEALRDELRSGTSNPNWRNAARPTAAAWERSGGWLSGRLAGSITFAS